MLSKKVFRFFLIWAIIITLVVSIVLSVKSFTGYIVTDEVNNNANMLSLAFFFLGLGGAFVWLRKFKR